MSPTTFVFEGVIFHRRVELRQVKGGKKTSCERRLYNRGRDGHEKK